MLQHAFAIFWVLLAIATSVLAFFAPRLKTPAWSKPVFAWLNDYAFVIAVIVAAAWLASYYIRKSYRDAERSQIVVEAPVPATKPSDQKPAEVNFSVASALVAALDLKSPTSGINCSQVRHEPDGTWTVTGSIRVFGTTLSHIRGLGPHAFSIGGYDVASLISEKCPVIDLPPVR